MFGPRFAGSKEKHSRNPRGDGRTEGVLFRRAENQRTFPWTLRALPSSGSAPLAAVVKTANYRSGNHGSEFQSLHGPQFRRILGQRDVRPGRISLAGIVKPR
jgi:hypothetical protein